MSELRNRSDGLDHEVGDRQSFAGYYARPKDLAEAIRRYREGELHLPPHPVWRGDFTDWAANPYSDRNWQFQHHTLRWVNALRWAAFDGDAWARDEWVRVARSWFEHNVPASSAKGPFAWKDMADGNRAIQLSLGARLIDDEDPWFALLLEAHRDWLLDESHVVGGNHGMHQHAGLLVVAATLRDSEAASVARQRMDQQFRTTFDDEGCNDEGSTAYHMYNIQWWTQTWERVAKEGLAVPESAHARLEAAATALAHLVQPDGGLPQIGDSARSVVRKGLGSHTDFVATRGMRGAAPGSTTLVLNGGYIASRSGWGESRPIADESHMVVRHGSFMRAHGHHDLGSVHLYALGRRWLTDPGFHSYQLNDPTRQYLASREAHNVPVIVGLDRKPDASVDLIRFEADDDHHELVLEDHGYPGVVLQRRVLYLTGPDCWLVVDGAEGDVAGGLRQHWQVDVGVETHCLDRGFRLSDGSRTLHLTSIGPAARIRRTDATDGGLTGWIGTKWKTLEPGSRLSFEAPANRNRIATLIAPARSVPLGLVDSNLSSQDSLGLDVVRGPDRWTVLADADGVRVSRPE